MNAEEARILMHELESSGNCSHPIRLSGEMVNLATGEVGSRSLRISCKDRRRVVCPSCSYTYQTDAWILVSSGLVGGKGTPDEVGSHPRLFVTLTAPSFGAVHTIRAGGECVVRASTPKTGSNQRSCAHGRVLLCRVRHAEDSPELGRPLCAECFDYEGAILWNAHASRLWNKTIQSIRRSLAEAGGLRQKHLKSEAQVHYLKVAELQRRGLVHFHVLVRADGPDNVGDATPTWLTTELLQQVMTKSIRLSSVVSFDGVEYRWGRLLDVQDLGATAQDANTVASYLAKYVTKTADGSKDLARQFKSRRQIQMLVDDPHARRLALTSWTMNLRPEFRALRLREHAHTFGFTGQLITKSRNFSTTFKALRSTRADYMAAQNVLDPVEGSFRYEGRGYDNPKATQLAELFFAMHRDLRAEGAEARRNTATIKPEPT